MNDKRRPQSLYCAICGIGIVKGIVHFIEREWVCDDCKNAIQTSGGIEFNGYEMSEYDAVKLADTP